MKVILECTKQNYMTELSLPRAVTPMVQPTMSPAIWMSVSAWGLEDAFFLARAFSPSYHQFRNLLQFQHWPHSPYQQPRDQSWL